MRLTKVRRLAVCLDKTATMDYFGAKTPHQCRARLSGQIRLVAISLGAVQARKVCQEFWRAMGPLGEYFMRRNCRRTVR